MTVYIIGPDGIDTVPEFLGYLDALANMEERPLLALDIETVEDIVIGIGVGDSYARAYFSKSDVNLLLPYIRGRRLDPWVMHNGKSDVTGLRKVWPDLHMIGVWDTMVAANVLGYDDIDLQTCAAMIGKHIGKFADLVKQYNTKDLEGVPEHVVADYNLSQVEATWELYKFYRKSLEYREMMPVFDLEMRVLPILAQMEENGILIDAPRLAMLRERYVAEAEGYIEALRTLTGGRIQNPNSPKQVAEFLYGFLGHKVIRNKGKNVEGTWVQGSPTTNEHALRKIQMSKDGELPEYKWINSLLKARQTLKLVGTYCDGIAATLDEEGRTHTQLSQTTADTGRLASRDPNHQNIPKRRGPEIRRCFVAPPGYVLVAADMDQLELRIIAAEAQEENMLRVFRDGGDIHVETAVNVLGDKSKRFAAKILNYTIVYLAGPEQVATQMSEQGVPTSKAKAEMYQNAYFRKYPVLTEWIGYWGLRSWLEYDTETWLGRHRPMNAFMGRDKNYPRGTYPTVPTPGHPGKWLPSLPRDQWGEVVRKAVNTRIQGTAAEIMKLNMIKVEERLRSMRLKSRQLIQIHDELLLEVPARELGIVSIILEEEMTTNYKGLQLPCTVKVGANWGDVH